MQVIPYSFSSPKIRRSITATYRRPRRSGAGKVRPPDTYRRTAATHLAAPARRCVQVVARWDRHGGCGDGDVGTLGGRRGGGRRSGGGDDGHLGGGGDRGHGAGGRAHDEPVADD